VIQRCTKAAVHELRVTVDFFKRQKSLESFSRKFLLLRGDRNLQIEVRVPPNRSTDKRGADVTPIVMSIIMHLLPLLESA
jgi:transglutaminase/protease-like cytokinesis protein 3